MGGQEGHQGGQEGHQGGQEGRQGGQEGRSALLFWPSWNTVNCVLTIYNFFMPGWIWIILHEIVLMTQGHIMILN